MQWLWNRGDRIIGVEHDLGEYTVDACGLRVGASPRITIVEAKASRADFLSDFQPEEKRVSRDRALLAQLAAVETRQAEIKPVFDKEVAALGWMAAGDTQIGRERQQLRQEERRLRQRRGDRRGRKGDRLVASRAANQHWLITPPSLITPDEAPGWGLLELHTGGAIDVIAPARRHVLGHSPAWWAEAAERLARRTTLNLLRLLDARWLPKKHVRLVEALEAA